ncbi:hypothetical protein BDV93DRAFT_530084 [Ceratobasidium sp. AG-I]|nr:hypothetical protein BDV93DRAFT_530084 [Ceratobasidium sp. AG-I]
MAFVTSLPTAITTYASLFLLTGLISMTIVKGRGSSVEEQEVAYTLVVLVPIFVMLVCCAGTVVGCEIVGWMEDKSMQERKLKDQVPEEGAEEEERIIVEMLRKRVRKELHVENAESI